MKNPIEYLDRFGFDRNDKIAVANFCVLFGISGMALLMMGYTEWRYTALCCLGSSVVVLTQHYIKKYLNRCSDPLLMTMPPK